VLCTGGARLASAHRSLGSTDFEDAMQAASAEACGAHWLSTRDSADFAASPVSSISAADFLARFPLPAS